MFICLKKKPPRHVENVIMMFYQAGFSDNALFECVYSRRLLFLQCAIYMVASYSYMIDAVTSLSNNFSITQ